MATTKQLVLQALLAHEATWCSGDALAQELGLSRESVWKAINALRKAGHVIDSRKSQGYRYDGSAHLAADVIDYYLSGNLAHLTVKDKMVSTQDMAKTWLAAQSIVAPAAFVADQQTRGYGRRGRAFYSPAGTGLYLSLVLPNPSGNLAQVGLLTTGVAVAAVKVLQQFFPDADFGLKWVNDIVVNHKKVGGILCEAVVALESGSSSAFVVGIGLNLATVDFPDDLAAIAGGISQNPGDRNQLAAALIDAIQQVVAAYPSGDFLPAYRELSTILQRNITLSVGRRQVSGVVVGIAPDGGLQVQTANGLETFNSGEVVKVDASI